MELIKVTIFIIAMTMALSITIVMKSIDQVESTPPFEQSKDTSAFLPKGLEYEVHPEKSTLQPTKRLGRFLIEERNPRAADHCHKDNEICYYIAGGKNATCCNNKCVDLYEDSHNCGACKNKCKFTQTCCRGQCVYLAFDKRHCGACNHRCETGQYCVDGMCDYA